MSQQDPVTVCGGKYTFFLDSEDGLLNCDRHGEPWPGFRGDRGHFSGPTLALYQKIVEMKKRVRRLNWVRCNAKGCACSSIECDCREAKVSNYILCLSCLNKGHGAYPTDQIDSL